MKPSKIRWIIWCVMLGGTAGPVTAQTGRDTYEAICATCHGPDGAGEPGAALFEMPLPDFTDCNFNSREPDGDFLAVAWGGGPARGFSANMPAHGDALSREQLQQVLDYIRGFCLDAAWPRGELNLPRPLVTEKAFPEDEAVITTVVPTEGLGAVVNELLYEKRFGPRNQIEIKVPFGVREQLTPAGDWTPGIGDIALGFKRAVFHRYASGSILSLGGEVVLPTGDESNGFGKGTVVVEPFVSFGQILPGDGFLHVQALAEFPADGDRGDPEVQLRTAFGLSRSQGITGRTWSPMVEVITKAEFASTETEYGLDVIPQMQVTLNQRQHIMLNLGVRIPVTDAGPRPTQLMVYLLWDWFDGGFFDGW